MRIETTIRELPSGWLWKERGTLFKTANSAIKTLKKEDGELISAGNLIVIRKTNWETTSKAGQKIIRFLTS
jgi:hypothetical protein